MLTEFLALLGLIALTALTLRVAPSIAATVFGPTPSRITELDGLRGLLSILVVLHHCVIFRIYAATGIYDSPASNIENLAGDASVALFFIITAYLLWGRMLRTGGHADWEQFFIGRFRRLTPMYMLAVACLVLIVLVETGFTLHVPLSDFIIQVLRWMGFALLPQSDINGRPDTHAIEVVLWTLKYEWVFYLGIPLLAIFAKGNRPWALYLLALTIAIKLADTPLYGYFVVGAVSAHLAHKPDLIKLPPWLWGGLSLVALVLLTACYHDIYGLPQMVLLFFIFQGVLSGTGIWRVLRAQSLRFLGNISYSTYLLHHMLIHMMVFWIFGAPRFAALNDWEFAAASVAAGCASIALAITTYIMIEQRWMTAPGRTSAPSP